MKSHHSGLIRLVVWGMVANCFWSLSAGAPEKATLLDAAPFGYRFLARSGVAAPPETQWLIHAETNVVAGVMWEEHRPVREVEVEFDQEAPPPEEILLEVTTSTPTEKQNNRPTWWTRSYEPFPGKGQRSPDRRSLSFATDRELIVQRLAQYHRDFQYEADPQGLLFVDKVRVRFLGGGQVPQVTRLRVMGLAKVVPIRFAVEWGWQKEHPLRELTGEIEVYNGCLNSLRPLAGAVGCAVDSTNSWRARHAPGRLCGLEAEVAYVVDDAQEVVFRPSLDLPAGSTGRLTYHPNRTVVTLRTSVGDFSVAPKDLEGGDPIVIPGLGFAVRPLPGKVSTAEFMRQLRSRGEPTVRTQVRSMPEQSVAHALGEQYGTNRPAFPRAEVEPPMSIDVPDELAMAAWRTAFWHVQRRCLQENGVYQIYIWPYKALLGQESWRIFYALDLLGEHDIPRSGFQPWFRAQGERVARGMFASKEGALNVSGWDLNHGQGHGSMLFALAQHYLLTGDRAWLAAHRVNFVEACAWIEKERRQWIERAGPSSWSAGLMPPCELGDYADWRSLYQTSFFFWRGLHAAAGALEDLEPELGARFLREAEGFRKALVKASERSVALTPVQRVRDGTYRRYIPPQPFLRGLCAQITNPFGGAHAGSLVMDGDLGAVALGLGVLGAEDKHLDETLDVLEDVIYHDNWMVRMHSRERAANRAGAWFTMGGYYYQCGYSQSALAHLWRDDVPNYLRSMFNQYAADVDPDRGYQFREHPNRTGEGNGGDKTFEVAAFLERMRAMFVMETDNVLWLARGTPRAWLEDGRRIAVRRAPSRFGEVGYEIVSHVRDRFITVTVDLPERSAAKQVLLRLRHPQAAGLRGVEVQGRRWDRFDAKREVVRLDGLSGRVVLRARY